MRRSLVLSTILIAACAHRPRPPRQPPIDAGNGELMYVSWGRNPERADKKATTWALRYCAAAGTAATIDRKEAVPNGRLNEIQVIFHCAGPPPGAPPGDPAHDAHVAHEELEQEEEGQEAH